MVANDEEEKKIISMGYKYIVGVDEAGMGSLAGEVYVGAVIFPINIDFKKLLPGLNDSKTKTPEQREKLYELVKKHAISYSFATASVQEINELNIYWARFLAARRAISKLSIQPDYAIMDGNAEIPDITIPQHAIIKGDQKSISIAAASIMAKVERDRYMCALAAKVNSEYGWITNKAYYSQSHVAALKKHGKTLWHRNKFIEKFI